MTSILTELFNNTEQHDNSTKTPTKLTPAQIKLEIENLSSLPSPDTPPLLVLFIIEKLSHLTCSHEYIEASLLHLRESSKYAIFNLRVFKTLQKCCTRNGFTIPLASHIISILRNLKIENDERREVDWTRLKVGNDAARSVYFVTFVVEKLMGLLLNNLNCVSNSVGFPEVVYWIIKELNGIILEGECDRMIKDVVRDLEEQKRYVLDERKMLKMEVYDRKKIDAFEKKINKLRERMENKMEN